MTNYSVVFHADTALDYNQAYIWYEGQKAGLGDTFLVAVSKKVHKVADNPEIYSVKSKSGYHEALVDGFPFSIVYRINKKQMEVFITSIHHQKKHPRGKYRR